METSPKSRHGALIVLVCLLFLVTGATCCGRGSVYLENNQYKRVLIAIGPQVPEDPALIEKIKDIFTKASAYLYQATRKRAYFKEITILVPTTWKDKPEYKRVTTESFDKSDIVADVPDKRFNHGNKPFTIKTTPCGDLGHYMHLTPDYLMNDNIGGAYGPYEKVIVHEWGHLRWGVFDEYPMPPGDDHFYSASNGEPEGTRCSLQVEGKMYNYKTGSDYCNYVGTIPDKFCRLKEKSTSESGYGSLMGKQYLNQVTEFCDGDMSNSKIRHNYEAPTMQNRQCDRSVWEIMREHVDFKNKNPPRNVSSTEPTFKVVREKSKRTVLVLDVSGSMKDNGRIGKLRQACSLFIRNAVKNGDYVGVVWFNNKATRKTALTLVSDSTRKVLLNAIPSSPKGGTSIGAGIQAGVALLGNEPDGGSLLVVTDGVENTAPFIRNVKPEVMRKNVIVDSLAISKMADTRLDALAQATGGKAFFYPDTSVSSNVLNEALIAIGERNTNVYTKTIPIKSVAQIVQPAAAIDDFTYIDSSVGNETSFNFDLSFPLGADVVLTSPSGVVIDKTSKTYMYDAAFRSIRISLPKAEVGKWTYKITNTKGQSQRIATTISSQAAKFSEIPLAVNAYWGANDIALSKTVPDVQRLYVSVSRGYAPILDAKVIATIERPGNEAPLDLAIYDNGAGADVNKNDGIYSNYFSQFAGNGRYNLKVSVTNEDGTVLSPSRVIGVGVSDPSVLGTGSYGAEDIRAENFQRVASAGSFNLAGYSANKKYYAPAKITDLTVSAASYDEYSVTLKWTATGSELTHGTSSKYQLRISRDFRTMQYNLSSCDLMRQEMVVNGGVLSSPKSAGTPEEFTIRVPTRGNLAYYFAVTAEDDTALVGARSNIVSASMRKAPTRGLSDVAIIAIIISVLVFIVLVVVLVIICMKRRQRSTAPPIVDDKHQENSYDNDAFTISAELNEIAESAGQQSSPYRTKH